MNRNSTTLFLVSPGATTPVPWVNNAPDFSSFTEPTLSVLVTAWNDFISNGGVVEVVPDPEVYVEPPVPDWDGFNSVFLADVAFNQYCGTCLGLAPVVAMALPTALAQVTTNGIASFSMVFTNFCAIASVTSQDRNDWGDIAESYDLPVDFVQVIRGT